MGSSILGTTNDPQVELFNVRFTAVGNNKGDYEIRNENSITRYMDICTYKWSATR
jgi:hypothetical protein